MLNNNKNYLIDFITETTNINQNENFEHIIFQPTTTKFVFVVFYLKINNFTGNKDAVLIETQY